MIVEFTTIVDDTKRIEQCDKMNVPYKTSVDDLRKITLDISQVYSFFDAYIYIEDKRHKAVGIISNNGDFTTTLGEYAQFKKLWQKANNRKVITYKQAIQENV